MENWLGPVTLHGREGRETFVLGNKVSGQQFNTLLFTGTQLVALQLGPDDLQGLPGRGVLNAVSRFVSTWPQQQGVYNRTTGGAQSELEFDAFNTKRWGDIVKALCAQPLDALIAHHPNFGLPYSQIQRVEVKNGLINPGVTFHLTDGSQFHFVAMSRDRLAEIERFLSAYVQVGKPGGGPSGTPIVS